MNATKSTRLAPEIPTSGEESAVSILRQLDEDRGPLLSDREHAEMRASILQELAAGAELRPFTLFTFGTVVACLLGLMALGLHLALLSMWEGWVLLVGTLGVLGMALYFGWTFREGIRRDRRRTLDARLAELDELLRHKLISEDEFIQIRAGILSSRQHGGPRS